MGEWFKQCPHYDSTEEQRRCGNYGPSRFKRAGLCYHFRDDGTDHCDYIPPRKKEDNTTDEGWAPSYKFRNNPS